MKTLMNPVSLKGELAAGKKTAVLFVMSMCPFCRRFRPVFESFAAARAADYGFVTAVLDDDRNPLWDEYSVNVVPTVIVFEGETELLRLDGRPGEGLSEKDLKSL